MTKKRQLKDCFLEGTLFIIYLFIYLFVVVVVVVVVFSYLASYLVRSRQLQESRNNNSTWVFDA